MKSIYGLILVFLIVGCHSGIKKISSDCESYVNYFESVWGFNHTAQTYYFKGNPDYWKEIKRYVNEDCLLGRNKKEITKLFGTPSQEIRLHNVEFLTYCIDKDCLYSRGTKHKQVSFFIDSLGVVGKITVVPVDVPDFH